MTVQNAANRPQPTVKATPAKPQAAAKPQARTQAPSTLGADSFMDKAPTKAQLDAAQAAVDAVAKVPGIPLSNTAKAAWLTDAKQKVASAKAGAETLADAAFWHKSVPQEQVDKAYKAVDDLNGKIARCEERGGFKPYPKPLNPFRPFDQLTKDAAQHGGWGVLTMLVTIPVDMIDKVSRPIQAVVWPFAWAAYGVRAAGRGLGVG